MDRKKYLLIVAIISLLLVLNLYGRYLTNRQGQIKQLLFRLPEKIILGDAYKDKLILVTEDNSLLLLDRDFSLLKKVSVKDFITTMTISQNDGNIYLGSAANIVYIFDKDLNLLSKVSLKGRITGLTFTERGEVIATYGIGYTDKYYIGILSKEGNLRWETKVGLNTTSICGIGSRIIFGTFNGIVGSIDNNGHILWTKTLYGIPTYIKDFFDTKKKRTIILIADNSGNITYIDEAGGIIKNKKVSSGQINSLYIETSLGYLLTASSDGSIGVIDPNGKLVTQVNLVNNPVISLLTLQNSSNRSIVAITKNGEIFSIDPSLANLVRVIEIFNKIRFILNIILSLSLLGIILSLFKVVRSNLHIWVREISRSKTAYLLLFPTFVLLFIFCYYPALTALYYSFTDFNINNPPKFIGLDNFKQLLQDEYVRIGIKNMIILTVTSIIKVLTVPLLLAELVFWLVNPRIKYIVRTLFISTSIVPGVVSILLWRMIYDPTIGLLNQILDKLNLGFMKRAWLGEEGLALWSIIFAGFPFVNAFAFLIYLGGLLNINTEIYDSAVIDGVSKWDRFWKIDLPLIGGQIRLLIILTVIGGIQEFTSIYLFTRGGPGNSTYVPALHMYYQIAQGSNYGYASAIGFFLFLLVLVFTVFSMRMRMSEVS